MKKKFSFAVIFFIAGIILAVFISISAVRESYRSKTIEQEVENLKKEADRIQSENDAMTERIAYFETSEFQEKIAKEKLNLQKPDENVVVVKQRIDQKPLVAQDQASEVQIEGENIQNYQKWWNHFFKY
jgi:cell division protein FtsL